LKQNRLTSDDYIEGILKHDKFTLAKAITLVESFLPEDQNIAQSVLDSILPHTGNSIRIGITGVPGVGKSTFIEAFGLHLTGQNIKVAILTVDPSSAITKGSILGDKTRMEELSKHKLAFIRPSASRRNLGGVAHKTREAMMLCEAAGFEVIIIETVGVGQSETSVKDMIDFFLLLMLAGAGDELQGIKKGIIEMADALVITKADGDNIKKAKEAQAEYTQALHLLPPKQNWAPKVLTCSALQQKGIDEVWQVIRQFVDKTRANGSFDVNRKEQNVAWFNNYFEHMLMGEILSSGTLRELKQSLEADMRELKTSPSTAARTLLNEYHRHIIQGGQLSS
jgi:LAO/AO transport system kinase